MATKPFEFPDWMSGAGDLSELESQYAGLGDAFDTTGLQNAYGQQQAFNTTDARARSSAMAAAAQNRARRSGGQAAASFAAGGANLQAMRLNADILGQLEAMKMSAAQNRASLGAQLAGQLAGARQNQTGQMANFFNASQDRTQQNNQFGRSLAQDESQFSRNLTQSGSQFDRNLAQQGSQFGSTMDYQNRSLAQSGSQFDRSFGLQQGDSQFARLQAALQLTPRLAKYGQTTNSGAAADGNNNFSEVGANEARRTMLQNRLLNYAGI